MSSRQQGFSLVELSFVLMILLVLAGITAGGGAYLANEAKSHKMAEIAKTMFNAINQYKAKTATIPNSGFIDGNTAILASTLSSYLEDNTTSYLDPWTGATKQFIGKSPPFVQADYGSTTGTWTLGLPTAPRLIYLPNTVGSDMPFTVWDQDQSYSFRFFAVQALDHRGYVVATYGR